MVSQNHIIIILVLIKIVIKMKKIYIILILFSVHISLVAQNDTIDIFNLTLEELMELKITSVSKISESALEVPQTIIIISEEEIRQRGYIDLEQLFHDLPGFDISRGNGTQYSQIYQRGYRSKNTERTSLLIDGVEENDLWSNSVWLSRQYPLSNVKRVEVIYGPASTMYGANAFLGVINIVTKTSDDIIKSGNKVGVSSQTGYGSWNTMYTDISLASKFSDDVSLFISGRIYKSDEMDLSGYDDWDYDLSNYSLDYYKTKLGTTSDIIAQAAKDLDNQSYYNDPELNGISPKYSNTTDDFLIYGKLKMKNFTLGFQTYKRDEGYGSWYRDDYELGPENGGSWVPMNTFLYTKYEHKFNDKLSATSFSSFKSHKLDGSCEEFYYIGYMNGGYGLSDLTNNAGDLLNSAEMGVPYWWHAWYHTYSQQMRSELRFAYNPNDRINIVTGVEVRYTHAQGNYIVSTTENPEDEAFPPEIAGGNHFFSTDIGLFAQGNFKFTNNLKVVAGARIDNNKIRTQGGYGTVINPKFAIVYTPGDFILKGMYSQAFMDASYWTKFGTTPGRLLNNPTLTPEEVDNTEISAAWKINNYLFTDIGAYHSNYDGIVGTARVQFEDEDGTIVETEQHQALGSLTIQGLYGNFRVKYMNYSACLNYTYTSPYNTTETEKVRIGDIADHQFNAIANVLFFEKLNINLRLNYVGEKPTGAETTISSNPLTKIDPYTILSGAISYKIHKAITLQVTINNILDTEYYHPGIRSANGDYYASVMPQNELNYMLKLYVDL